MLPATLTTLTTVQRNFTAHNVDSNIAETTANIPVTQEKAAPTVTGSEIEITTFNNQLDDSNHHDITTESSKLSHQGYTTSVISHKDSVQTTEDSNFSQSDGATVTSVASTQSTDVTESADDVARIDSSTTSRTQVTGGRTRRRQMTTMTSATFQKHSTQHAGLDVTEDTAHNDSSMTTHNGLIGSDGGSGDSGNLLWLPYVLLTISLIFLLFVSFARYHCKNKDRYRKRAADPAFSNSNGHFTGLYSTARQASRARIIYNTNLVSSQGLLQSGSPTARSIIAASLSPLQDGVSIAAANAQFHELSCNMPVHNGGVTNSRGNY